MNVPAGTVEYQESLKKAKAHLIRLFNGLNMLDNAVEKSELLQAQKIIKLWDKIANELFVELEIATLIHQSNLTGNKVVVKADGTLIKVEEFMGTESTELDPWTLLSMEKLKSVFGEDIHNFLTVQ